MSKVESRGLALDVQGLSFSYPDTAAPVLRDC